MSLSVNEFELLGKGFNGVVYRGELNYKPVAVKILTKPQNSAQFLREIERLKLCDDVNVVKFFGSVTYKGKMSLIMELAHGGTLHEALGKKNFPFEWRKSTIVQIASGVDYLHQQGVIHRDLKPKNILFRDVVREQVLIADFGLCVDADERSYMGAAIFGPTDSQFDSRSDVYCLGVIACCVIANEIPDNRKHVETITGKVVTEKLQQYNERWFNAIKRSLSQKSSHRPTAKQFKESFLSICEESKRSDLESVLVAGAGVALVAGLIWGAVKLFSSGEDKDERDKE